MESIKIARLTDSQRIADSPWICDGDQVEEDLSGVGHCWRELSLEDYREHLDVALFEAETDEVVIFSGQHYRRVSA